MPVVLKTATRTPWICGLGVLTGSWVVSPVAPVGDVVPVAIGPAPPVGTTPPPPSDEATPSGNAWLITTTPPTTRATMSANRMVLAATER